MIKSSLPPDAWNIDLLEHEVAYKYAKQPGRFLDEAERRVADGCRTIFIDEVQKVPALLDGVQALIDRSKVSCILSGSSVRKLRRGGANLLGGRASMRRLHPLTAAEMGDAFDLDRALRFGTLPRIAASSDDDAAEMLRAYAETYVREEIVAEALVRDLGTFGRFLDVAAAQSGDVLNVSGVARDAGVAVRTVTGFYEILEDTLLGFRLDAWRKGVRARMVAHPKFLLFDTGVQNAFNRRLSAPPDPRERGRLFEQWFVLECRRRFDYAGSEARLFYWRTNTGVEVDLILEKHGRPAAAIECKSSARVARTDTSGLRAFAAEYPQVPLFVATAEETDYDLDGVRIVHWRRLLELLAEIDAEHGS